MFGDEIGKTSVFAVRCLIQLNGFLVLFELAVGNQQLHDTR